MNNYKLRISYDGTAYQGWQVQPNGPTVAGTLEQTFTDTFSHQLSMVGASRTDSGVHAYDQVARVRTDLTLPAEKLLHAWNNALPDDIVIRSIEVMPDSFHPHHDVAYKEYEYRISRQRPLPFLARFCWWPSLYTPLDVAVYEQALQLFVGTHDFTAFSKDEPGRQPVRAVDAITVRADEQTVVATIRAKGFLRYQIRRMIGAAVMAASHNEVTVDRIADALREPHNEHHQLIKAEAHGLCLRRIVYEGEK